jgi:hypothetical protein
MMSRAESRNISKQSVSDIIEHIPGAYWKVCWNTTRHRKYIDLNRGSVIQLLQ